MALCTLYKYLLQILHNLQNLHNLLSSKANKKYLQEFGNFTSSESGPQSLVDVKKDLLWVSQLK